MTDTFFLTVQHTTHYDFSEAVSLEPHSLFFQPISTVYGRVESHRLEVTPQSDGLSPVCGLEGQLGSLVWFSGLHKHLHIFAETILKISPYNSFGFLIYPGSYTHHPFEYASPEKELLVNYLFPRDELDSELRKYAAKINYQADSDRLQKKDTVSLIWESLQTIHQDFTLVYRKWGAPQSISKIYQEQKGSCRDLSHLLIEIFRYWGIASRFVSGYLYLETPNQQPEFELHSWVEIYLPGAGWIGLDPSHGLFTDHHYIPVSQSSVHEQTLPVMGFYRGKAKSKLTTELKMVKSPIDSC